MAPPEHRTEAERPLQWASPSWLEEEDCTWSYSSQGIPQAYPPGDGPPLTAPSPEGAREPRSLLGTLRSAPQQRDPPPTTTDSLGHTRDSRRSKLQCLSVGREQGDRIAGEAQGASSGSNSNLHSSGLGASLDSISLAPSGKGRTSESPGESWSRGGGERGKGKARGSGALVCPLPAKQLFKHCMMEDMVGKGRYGTVWKCVDLRTGTELACKQLDKSGNSKYLAREIECFARAQSHANVLSLNGVYESELYLYLVTELCNGGDLFEYLNKNGVVEENDARGLFCQVVEAVRHCHARGIIHRDIKPENVLLHTCPTTGQRTAKLADFGLAKRLRHGEMTVGWVGSEPYEAPEVLASEPYDFSSDVFSLGVVLFGLLSGTWPSFVNGRVFDAEADFSWPGWWTISREAKDLIAWMLSTNALERPTTAEILESPWVMECSSRRGQRRSSVSDIKLREISSMLSKIKVSGAERQQQQRQRRREGKPSSSAKPKVGSDSAASAGKSQGLHRWDLQPLALSRTTSPSELFDSPRASPPTDCPEESSGFGALDQGTLEEPSEGAMGCSWKDSVECKHLVLPSPVDCLSGFSFADSTMSSPSSWSAPSSE